MKYNEVMAAFDGLSPAEKVRFLSDARATMAADNATLRTGAKVQFKTKNGYIPGTFIRAKRKNAEILSVYGRYGVKSVGSVHWSVPFSGIIPIPADKVSLYEFPVL